MRCVPLERGVLMGDGVTVSIKIEIHCEKQRSIEEKETVTVLYGVDSNSLQSSAPAPRCDAPAHAVGLKYQ